MRVYIVFIAVTRNWLRSRSGLFFSFLFPVMLLLILGSIYGTSVGPGQGTAQPSAGYFLPGLTAAFIMTNGVIGLTNVGSELKRNGVLKRLSSTPLTKLDWLLGNILSQTVLALALAAVMLLLGVVLYRAAVTVSALSVAILVAGTLLFSGLGMTLAGVVNDAEVASGLGNVIAFPMMLLSGTFWSIGIMPTYLQALARALPLTYFAEGLRDSMFYGDVAGALTDLAVVAAFAVVLVLVGSRFTRWNEP